MGESGREIEFLARPNVKMRLCPRCRWGRRKSGIKAPRDFQQSPGSQEENSIFFAKRWANLTPASTTIPYVSFLCPACFTALPPPPTQKVKEFLLVFCIFFPPLLFLLFARARGQEGGICQSCFFSSRKDLFPFQPRWRNPSLAASREIKRDCLGFSAKRERLEIFQEFFPAL